jgi:hypothetical protein
MEAKDQKLNQLKPSMDANVIRIEVTRIQTALIITGGLGPQQARIRAFEIWFEQHDKKSP